MICYVVVDERGDGDAIAFGVSLLRCCSHLRLLLLLEFVVVGNFIVCSLLLYYVVVVVVVHSLRSHTHWCSSPEFYCC